jgi:hypothetical protein
MSQTEKKIPICHEKSVYQASNCASHPGASPSPFPESQHEEKVTESEFSNSISKDSTIIRIWWDLLTPLKPKISSSETKRAWAKDSR